MGRSGRGPRDKGMQLWGPGDGHVDTARTAGFSRLVQETGFSSSSSGRLPRKAGLWLGEAL